MRISDWSSDVCSSDLLTRSGCHGREPFLDAEQSAFMMLLLGKPAQRVFDNDDGAIDDQTEVQGAEAHQIGRDASTHHPEAGQQDRKSVVAGKSVSVRYGLGGPRILKKTKIVNH